VINQQVYPSLVVNHSIYTLAYLLVGFVVSSRSEIMPKIGTLGVRRKSIPPAYHTLKNRPRWRTYAQLKKLNGSSAPAVPQTPKPMAIKFDVNDDVGDTYLMQETFR